MSRSVKKVSIVKIGAGKERKSAANRRHRRAVKFAVQTDQEVLPLTGEITNQYDVCDTFIVAEKGDKFYKKIKRK